MGRLTLPDDPGSVPGSSGSVFIGCGQTVAIIDVREDDRRAAGWFAGTLCTLVSRPYTPLFCWPPFWRSWVGFLRDRQLVAQCLLCRVESALSGDPVDASDPALPEHVIRESSELAERD